MGVFNESVAAPFPTSEYKTTSEYGGADLGRMFRDGSGNIFMLVDCQEAFTAGEVVVIDADNKATQATAAARGAIGIIMSAPTASDTYAWAQVYGKNSIAVCASGVTSAGHLVLGVTSDIGYFSEGSSAVGVLVNGVLSRSACDTATTPGGFGSAPVGLATVQLIHPFTLGLVQDGPS